MTPDRVIATQAGVDLLTKLSELHGGLMIHQSGGCCDGSAPMCYPVGEFRVGQRDVLVGEVALPEPLPSVRIWIGGDQFGMADIPPACDVHRWWNLPAPEYQRPHYPHVERWFATLLARPATRGVLDITLE